MTELGHKPTLSGIIPTEHELEDLINELLEHIGRHAISIQGSPEAIDKFYGKAEVNPNKIQRSFEPPKTEPFLQDDFGWLLAFSFSIPFIIGVIIGIFFVGDLFSIKDNFIYGALGGIVGALFGAALSLLIKKHKESTDLKQEKKGGFVIWIALDDIEQKSLFTEILKKYHAYRIKMVRN